MVEWIGELSGWQRVTGAVAAAALTSYVVAELAARPVRVWLVRALQGDTAPRFADPIVRSPIRVTRAVVFVAALALAIPAALQAAGVALPGYLDDGLGLRRVVQSGPRVLVVALVAYLLMRGIALGTARWEQLLGQDTHVGEVERAKRARTVGSLVRNVLTAIVLSLAGLTILREFGVDIMPVVTGAGILGLAIGFGAQTLVRDAISGFFLIFENHLRVGDVAELAPLEVLGVDAFADSQVTIKVRIKTIPLKQWEVGRELRRRIKQAFDRHGIEIPFPHLSVYFGEASRPWRTESVDARTGSSPQPADGRPAPPPGDLS
ncbi:MAG: mechanosensitive ion channel family protein [Vicinamibacterales bacterium]